MAEFNKIEDSGLRQSFNTGSVRDLRGGKGRYDLISAVFLKRLARHYELGAEKYGDRNWEKGQPVSRYLDSAMRHVVRYLDGERGEDHLTASAWNLAAAIHTLEMIRRGSLPQELDDRPGRTVVEKMMEAEWQRVRKMNKKQGRGK